MKIKLNEIDDFYGIDGFNDENLFQIISLLNNEADEITIDFNYLKSMYEFEKAFVKRLEYFNNEYSSEDVCPPTRKYQRTADEEKLKYIIKKLK